MRARPDARAILVARDMPVLMKTEAGLDPLLPLAEIEALGGARVEALLGVLPTGRRSSPRFCATRRWSRRRTPATAFSTAEFSSRRAATISSSIDLRSIAAGGLVPADQASMLASAKALMHWHARRRFCSNCGQLTEVSAAGWRRECKNCGMQHFPRTDPVVIMLAVDGDDCLLGRQPRFPKGMYSALAGFVEPGETIEAAVRREILEESGIACGEVRYFASQPWPFPSSLMIGCFAQASSRALAIDRTELEDARWFSRAETLALLERRHPDGLAAPIPMAIAHHLLKQWATAGVEFRQPGAAVGAAEEQPMSRTDPA